MTGSWNSGEMMKKLIWLCVLLSTFVRGQSTWTGSATLQGNFSIGQNESVGTGSDENAYCGPGNAPLFGLADDVAALPQACRYTALSATPAPSGNTWTVNTGADMQTAINGLHCGDIISITAGVTISPTTPSGAPQFLFPALGCDDNHWIWVESSGISNAAFPPEGTRLTPCQAGVASLPGRPAYGCPAPQLLTAKILMTGSTLPITFVSGATHYRFMGLEITRTATAGGAPSHFVGSLVGIGGAHHIIFDRDWLHGVPAEGTLPQASGATTETNRGVNLAQSHSIAILHSYFTDFYCISVNGSCSDAQAFTGGIGTAANTAWGTYKIVDNFLEGAAETIIFGGGSGPCTNPDPAQCSIDSPADIEIRRNHMFKPLQWMPPPGPSSGFGGWPVVKNGFEIKNAVRVLLEGNIVENAWGGFSQVGYGFLFTPKSQSGLCPGCILTDVTARYNQGKHLGGGIQFLAANSDAGASCKGAFRESIHDNLFDGIYQDTTLVAADGYELDTSGSSGMTQDRVNVVHNTFTSAGKADILLGGLAAETNFIWRDNIMVKGEFNTVNRGNCDTVSGTILGKMNACWTNYSFLNNLMVGGSTATNFYPATTITSAASASAVEGGDLRLCKGLNNPAAPCAGASAYATAGSDGLPLGANITLVNQYTQGIQ